jgi:hypothetical protein
MSFLGVRRMSFRESESDPGTRKITGHIISASKLEVRPDHATSRTSRLSARATPATHLLAPTNGSRVYVISSPEANAATALLGSSSP